MKREAAKPRRDNNNYDEEGDNDDYDDDEGRLFIVNGVRSNFARDAIPDGSSLRRFFSMTFRVAK